jgi:hypothetical protein
VFVTAEVPASARSYQGEGVSAAARRERRRLQHQDLNRAQLLDAAEVVFGTKGFANATLKEIAELAGFAVLLLPEQGGPVPPGAGPTRSGVRQADGTDLRG